MKIVLTGGGTGGHIIPLITVAKKIKDKAPEAQFLFVGPRDKMVQEAMEAEGIKTKNVMSGKWRRYFSLKNFTDIFKIPVGILQALWILLLHMPDAIFSKGGYGTIPVVIVGWLYRIPILIHESDTTSGMANRMLGKFARRVAISYPTAEHDFLSGQAVLTGNPVRAEINQGDPQKAREMFSLLESKKTIFVWGGSQGSKIINEKILDILPQLLKNYQVIHQTGSTNFASAEEKAGYLGIKVGREGYHAFPYIKDELKDVLAAADLVISRAGANSISEIAANGKPAILIPLQNSANNHQKLNAFYIAKSGGCIELEENNLGENLLLHTIDKIMNDDNLRQSLSQNIKSFYHPDAADKIADGILGMIK